MEDKAKMLIHDFEDKIIEIDFRDIRKIYLFKNESYGEINYYNGKRIKIYIDTYYNIQHYLVDNHLINYFNRFELPKELQDKYDFDLQILEEYKILNMLVDKYEDKQLIVAIEELSELQKELCKTLRDKINRDNLIEEIADVEIMLQQLRIFFNISNSDILLMKNKKILRTKERLL